MSDIEPCPFCGVAVTRYDQPDVPGILHPENDCLLSGELWTFDKVELWNRRPEVQIYRGALRRIAGPDGYRNNNPYDSMNIAAEALAKAREQHP